MKAIQVEAFGGPEVLTLKDVEIGQPASDQVLIKNHTIGVNFLDLYQRQGQKMGSFPLPLPMVPGVEGAGVVAAVGDGVENIALGDRVAFLTIWGIQPGAYAEACLVPAKDVIPLPDDLSFEQGAALFGHGLTAHYLLHEFRHIRSGETVLVHAAAGGVGGLLVQWARHLGAHVIGTVSTRAKADAAHAAGAHDVINYTEQDFVTEVQRITNGQGAHLILDAVGQTTFAGDLEAVAVRGHILVYGASGGLIDPISPSVFRQRSVSVAGTSLLSFLQTQEELIRRATETTAGVRQGWLKLRIHDVLPLARAADAHRQLESRSSMGKLLLAL